ncbi:polysaccharide biosynthesis tyrosine autokinase [Klebsiella pneumoniae]|nr:polysaccharide biosynthesis tyrosine autokinase [Klebsiella pneumoniae]
MKAGTDMKKVSRNSDEINMGGIIGELLDYRKLISIIVAICFALAIIYTIFTTPVYQANASVQVEGEQSPSILSSLSQVLPDMQPRTVPEIFLLQSRLILNQTVSDLNLQTEVTQKFFPLFGRKWNKLTHDKESTVNVSELYLPMGEGQVVRGLLTVVDKNNYLFDFNGEIYKGKTGQLLTDNGLSINVKDINANPGDKFNVTYMTQLEAVNRLRDELSVADPGKDTGILVLSMTGTDKSKISLILNNILTNYVQKNVERKAEQDEKSLTFLDTQLPKVQGQLDTAEEKLNQYRQRKDTVDLSMEAQSVLNQIVNVDNQLNELTFREAEISQLYTKSHPTYKALMEKRATLESEKNVLNDKVSAMPETQQEVLRLNRNVESGRIIYMMLLNKYQELKIAKSSIIGNVRIIDNAITQPEPVKPKKILVIILGIAIGIVLSILIVLFKVLIRHGVGSTEQIEDLGTRVYAIIPLSDTMMKRNLKHKTIKNKQSYSLLAVEDPIDVSIEAIRNLRTSLHFAMLESSNNVLMITGANPGDGKTFIASNLSVICAQVKSKVLLIDGDMRKGYIHKLFGFENQGKGLSEILSGSCSYPQAVKKTLVPSLDVICRGNAPSNSSELLMSEQFSMLIEQASKEYDLVIIDSPPVLPVTDATIIGNYAATTFVVARFESDSLKEIEVSLKRLEQNNVKVSGVILNGVIKKASSYYGTGYSYGYSYEYDDHTGNKKKK